MALLTDEELLETLETQLPALLKRHPEMELRIYTAFMQTFATKQEVAAVLSELREFRGEFDVFRSETETFRGEFDEFRSEMETFRGEFDVFRSGMETFQFGSQWRRFRQKSMNALRKLKENCVRFGTNLTHFVQMWMDGLT